MLHDAAAAMVPSQCQCDSHSIPCIQCWLTLYLYVLAAAKCLQLVLKRAHMTACWPVGRFKAGQASEWESMVASNRPLLGDGFFAHLETRIKASHVRTRPKPAECERASSSVLCFSD